MEIKNIDLDYLIEIAESAEDLLCYKKITSLLIAELRNNCMDQEVKLAAAISKSTELQKMLKLEKRHAKEAISDFVNVVDAHIQGGCLHCNCDFFKRVKIGKYNNRSEELDDE